MNGKVIDEHTINSSAIASIYGYILSNYRIYEETVIKHFTSKV